MSYVMQRWDFFSLILTSLLRHWLLTSQKHGFACMKYFMQYQNYYLDSTDSIYKKQNVIEEEEEKNNNNRKEMREKQAKLLVLDCLCMFMVKTAQDKGS